MPDCVSHPHLVTVQIQLPLIREGPATQLSADPGAGVHALHFVRRTSGPAFLHWCPQDPSIQQDAGLYQISEVWCMVGYTKLNELHCRTSQNL